MSLYQTQKRIPLDAVMQRILDITGCALKHLGPDEVLDAMGADVHLVPDVDSSTDAELVIRLHLLDLWSPGASLALVPDVVYNSKPSAGFVVSTEELESFALGLGDALGESFFSCDCIVVGLDCDVIWVLHHAGAWAHQRFG